MAPMTDHEAAQAQVEYDRTWRRRVLELRGELMRLCPAGRFLDKAHLAQLVKEGPSSNKAFLAWAYLATHGARALGVAYELDEKLKERFLTRDVWWTPPTGYADALPEEYRAEVIGGR